MASEMIRPTVVSFLDIMLRSKDKGLRVEEAKINEGCKVENRTIREANIFNNIGLVVIAIKDSETGRYIYNPKSDTVLRKDDTLIVLGSAEQVRKLKDYTGSK